MMAMGSLKIICHGYSNDSIVPTTQEAGKKAVAGWAYLSANILWKPMDKQFMSAVK
jgi:hypothetical protein